MEHDRNRTEYVPQGKMETLLPYAVVKGKLNRCGLGSHADDIYQEMTIRLAAAMAKGKNISPAYVQAMFDHLVIDENRRRQKVKSSGPRLLERSQFGADTTTTQDPATIAWMNEEVAIVKKAMKKLTVHQRLVVNLRACYGWSFSEIGVLNKHSGRYAKQEYDKAIEQLRRTIKSEQARKWGVRDTHLAT